MSPQASPSMELELRPATRRATLSEPTAAEELALDSSTPAAILPSPSISSSPSRTAADVAPRGKDLEEGRLDVEPELDIEHFLVRDDPREWSTLKKNMVLAIIASTAMCATLPANIFFPGIEDLKRELKASDNLVSASVSLFVLGQGCFPMIWSAISEIHGRKMCYLASILFYCAGTTICARAGTIGLFIGMRIVQSLGASAVLSLGGGTLADIYDPEERGRKLGIFYGVPLLSPALGPVIGGLITAKSSWRATFYFLLAYGGVCGVGLIFLPETFRKERSLAWQNAMKSARAHAKAQREAARKALPQDFENPVTTKNNKTVTLPPDSHVPPAAQGMPTIERIRTALSNLSGDDQIKIRFSDVNPFATVGDVLRQPQNLLSIVYSSLLYGQQYSLPFTASRSFAGAPYNYDALDVGLCLLSFGLGNATGAIFGGRYSDYVLATLKAKNGGVGEPEMRIRSTLAGLILLPPMLIGYAWTIQEHTQLAGPLVFLYFVGLATIWIYSSMLVFVVDANPGRASSAVACNSLLRGIAGAIASQACGPIVEKMGNGWFWTGFAIILFIGAGPLLLVQSKGKQWRENYKNKEAMKDAKR